MTAGAEASRAIIEKLGLIQHPEGGWYKETWRAEQCVDGRSIASAILFLLEEGQRSHWHRVDADEFWLWHAGAPLTLRIAGDARTSVMLGPDVLAGHEPQARVPAGAWQAAEPVGGWTLVSCIVAPAFTFDGFTLAPPGWEP